MTMAYTVLAAQMHSYGVKALANTVARQRENGEKAPETAAVKRVCLC